MVLDEPTGFYEGRTGAQAWARWMLFQPDLVILDTETTGLAWWDEAVSLAAMSALQTEKEFSTR